MSDNLEEIHDRSSAILEKLYDEKGQPEEFDEAFVQEYFKLVQADLNLPVDDDEEFGPMLRRTDAKLSSHDKHLIEVFIPSKDEKFVVTRLNVGKLKNFPMKICSTNRELVNNLPGTSQRFGRDRGSGNYVMRTIIIRRRGSEIKVPQITISSGNARVIVSHTFVFIVTRLTY